MGRIMRIKTFHLSPPIDSRWDWCAWDADEDDDQMLGSGITKEEAIEDLMRLLLQRAECEQDTKGKYNDRP
jgi:hypothetical protein